MSPLAMLIVGVVLYAVGSHLSVPEPAGVLMRVVGAVLAVVGAILLLLALLGGPV